MLWLPKQILIAHILLMHAPFALLCTYIFYSFQSPPYAVYMQGGVVYDAAKVGILMAADAVGDGKDA